MDSKSKKNRRSKDYEPLYAHLVAAFLDELRIQYEASIKIVSRHLSTLFGIDRMQFRKGSREHKTAISAYKDGLKALEQLKDATQVLDNIIKKAYKNKKV